jgi:TgpA N-terminal domain/Transglutaminase-like superfamily
VATSQEAEKAPGSRLLYLLALLAVAVDAAAAFGRVFQGSGTALRLGLAAGVAVLLASLLERRHVLLATLASAAALTVTVGLMLFPKTLWHELPTASTWRAAVHAWARIGDIARTEVAPARPLAPLVLAGITAVWAAAFSSHALAVRARSPFLALLPPAALLAFPSILLSEGARPLYVLTFLLAVLLLLFADALRRVGQWGPITIWQGRRRLQLGTSGSLRGARWLGVCCVGIAVLIPGILPGYQRPGLIDVHDQAIGASVSIDPLVYIKPQLLRSEPVNLFSVTASQPTYWRFAALDTFDGQVWNSDNLDVSTGQDVRDGDLASQPAIDTTGVAYKVVNQEFHFQDLSQVLLPAAYDPVSLTSDTTLRFDPATSMLAAPDRTTTGFSYTVRSKIVTPTKDVLDTVTSVDSSEARRYLELPPIPQSIKVLAHRLTDRFPEPYEKVRALQNWFRQQFRYDVNAPAGHDVNHMEFFLFHSKAGYCEQFAGTMAVMLRILGIPARVAVGFTPGHSTPEKNTYEVTTDDAHAWVEVLFPKYGWLMFEPTPTRRNPATSLFDFPITTPLPSPGGGSPTCPELSRPPFGDACVGSSQQGGQNPGGRRRLEDPTTSLTGGSGTIRHPTNWKVRAFQLALLLALLILVAIPVFKAARRKVALKRARAPSERVLAAYQVLAGQARDLGLGRGEAETLWEYRTRLKERVPGLDGTFDRLTGLAGRAAYSNREISDQQASEALATVRRALRLIRRSRSMGRRAMGWFWIDRSSLVRWATG